jgi:hypothetical protein
VRPFLFPPFSYSLTLTPQPPAGLGQTPSLEEVIEFLEGVHRRHWHQEVAPGIAHQAFHQTLLMGLSRSAEAALK